MKYDLDKIKLGVIKPVVQVTIFGVDGLVHQSCCTMLSLNEGESIYDRFNFLASMEEYFQTMPVGEELRLNPMEWHEEMSGLFVSRLAKVDKETIQWILANRTVEQDRVKEVLRGRERAILNEEYLEIEKTLLETKKELLEYRNDELRRLQKFKERFFAAVSHEMRTPLNSITGLVKLLEWSEPKAIYDYLHALKATSEHLNHIINDVLDLSKIEEGKLILEKISFNIREIVGAINKGFTMILQDKGITLSTHFDESVPEFTTTDPTRVSQILYNMVGNSLKFTKEGGVKIAVKADGKELSFSIADTGIGMSQESIAHILEPYVQAEGQKYHEYGGTGLGMTIAHQLIKIMGGTLHIESELGKGSTINFTIPYEPADSANYTVEDHYDPAANVDVSRISFLFAEDDPMSIMIMKERSAKWNLNSTFVTTAQELTDELEHVKHDILISDLHLDEDYAPHIIINLRQSNWENRDIPVVFLSGDTQDMHPDLGKITNYCYLLKPVNPRTLSLRIREMLDIDTDNSLEGVDLKGLEIAAQNDKDFMRDLIDTILETLPEELERLEIAIKKDDLFQAARILHKIKPSISYLGIETLLSSRSELHDQAKKGLEIQEPFHVFKTRVNIALEDLAAKKSEI
jgi:signal transduction histidine kinase/DNA-binding response OmpR family regulator